MSVATYISQQPTERQQLLSQLHTIILQEDKTVTAVIAPMMGKEMIIYNVTGFFKYGLAGVKNYMSLHVMPMYASPQLYKKFKQLLPAATFQKGCINFTSEQQLPPAMVKELIAACSKIDLKAMRDEYLQAKATKKRKLK